MTHHNHLSMRTRSIDNSGPAHNPPIVRISAVIMQTFPGHRYPLVKDELLRRLAARHRTAARTGTLYKAERVLASPQQAHVRVSDGAESSTCAPTITWAWPIIPRCASRASRLDRYGYGMASVRFICGTQTIHKELEARLSAVSRHRRHDSLLLLLRRQRRPVRDAARRGGRDHQR